MIKFFTYIFFFTVSICILNSQVSSRYSEVRILDDIFMDYQQGNDFIYNESGEKPQNNSITSILNKRDYLISLPKLKNAGSDLPLSNDTLIIGPGEDTLLVEDNWFYDGTIIVFGNGKLIFRDIKASINGDLIVWGANAQLISHNSYIYMPQQYFYQRAIVAAGGAEISITNTTLDFNDLPHNLVIMDNSSVNFLNVINKGFTTCGMSGSAEIIVDSCNQTGEFILMDSVSINFSNANTILLWHLVDANQKLHIDFPDGDIVTKYALSKDSTGIDNINYTTELTNCTNVMWGLMPKSGSDIKISNSKLRTIGLWFNGRDTFNISGLVNNSYYSNFKADLKDRELVLENTELQTWSIYTFDNAVLNIRGSIIGELGAFGNSFVTGSNYMVDGSGGYLFASDTSFVINTFSTATCNIRSERNAVFLFGYSAQTNGRPAAIGNSILILVQSASTENPSYSEGAVVWKANITAPAVAYKDEVVNIIGSAWIDKNNESFLMDFKKYFLSYQKIGDSVWKIIGDTVYSEVRESKLGEWNVNNLEPGKYNIKLTLVSNTSDEFSVDAVKSINVLGFTDVLGQIYSAQSIILYPNPVTDYIEIRSDTAIDIIKISNIFGADIITFPINKISRNHYRIDLSSISKGVYFININGSIYKFVKL